MRFQLHVIAVLSGLAWSGLAWAAPARDVEVDYFAERALTTQVGTFTKPCGNGSARLVGHRTPFYVRSSSTCSGSSHAPPSTVSCHFSEAGCSDRVARRRH